MRDIKIACVGDIMCGDSFYSIGNGVAASLKKYGNQFLKKEMTQYLRSHHIVLANLECVLSDVGRKNGSLRSLQMRGEPKAAQYLANWGINIANLANNHVLEHSLKCAEDTATNLAYVGIKVIGAGKGDSFQPGIHIAEMTIDNQTFSFLGLCLLFCTCL